MSPTVSGIGTVGDQLVVLFVEVYVVQPYGGILSLGSGLEIESLVPFQNTLFASCSGLKM